MRAIWFLLGFGIFSHVFPAVASGEVNWRHEPERALEEAKEAGKPAMLFFTASWCGYCRMMDNRTFKDAGVTEALQDFIPVKVDHDTYPRWVARYGVRGVPAAIILNDGGAPVARADGFHDAANFTRWLRNMDEDGGGTPAGESMEAMAETLREGLNERDPEARAEAVAFAVEQYTGEDPVASGLAERSLKQAQQRRPEEFLFLLEDRRLAMRILAANFYREHFGEEFQFDPWASEEERGAYLDGFLAGRT